MIALAIMKLTAIWCPRVVPPLSAHVLFDCGHATKTDPEPGPYHIKPLGHLSNDEPCYQDPQHTPDKNKNQNAPPGIGGMRESP